MFGGCWPEAEGILSEKLEKQDEQKTDYNCGRAGMTPDEMAGWHSMNALSPSLPLCKFANSDDIQ